MQPVSGPQAFALHLDLGPVPASSREVQDEIGTRLDDLEPRFSWRKAELWVSLTVTAGDLWLAVLRAMAAVTGSGYPVVRLDARPVGPPGRDVPARPGPDG